MEKKQGYFTFLGTGGSMGVPLIGCDCNVCSSTNIANKRLRSSGLISIDDKQILIDCGPDFRQQMLQKQIKNIDGLIFTHAHYDHTAGLDEIRIFNARAKKPLPCLLSQATLDELNMRFPYIFALANSPTLTTKLKTQILENERGSCEFIDIPLSYMTYEQGGMSVNGYRFGNFAYLTDIRNYPETIFEDLEGVENLVISCLRIEASPLHFNVEDAVNFSFKSKTKKAWFTHIAHELEHDRINQSLPPQFQLARDGQVIEFKLP
jgi:phosphoribosyl 1,2-cyclic phosphate phosphodiesterase